MKFQQQTINALMLELDRGTMLAADHTGTARMMIEENGITPVVIEHLNIAAIAAGAALQIAQTIHASIRQEHEFGIAPREDDSEHGDVHN